MRKRIFEIIEVSKGDDKASSIYDLFIIFVIILSLIPLAFKHEYPAFVFIDKICAVIFIINYLIRWLTADYRYNNKSIKSFIRYPFSFMAIIDLVSILPSLTVLSISHYR